MVIKFLFYYFCQMEQKIEVVLYFEIVCPALILEFPETGRKKTFRFAVLFLQFSIYFLRTVLIHIPEYIHIISGKNLFLFFQMPRIPLVYNSNLDQLQDPVSQIIAAEIRIPVLIGSIHFNLVGHPPVPDPE